MSIARDRANRVGSDPLVIGASKISSNASDDLVVQDTSDNPKRLITSEMQIGDDDNDKIIIKEIVLQEKLIYKQYLVEDHLQINKLVV